jgi:transposase InsO family protein
MRLVALFKLAGNAGRDVILIVQPSTIKRWMHEFAKNIHTIKSCWGKVKSAISQMIRGQKRTGRKSVDQEIIDMILKIKRENPRYGAGTIRGILWKNEILLSRSTIHRILQKHYPSHPDRKQREIEQDSITWAQFFFALKEGIHAMDMFTIFSFLGKQIFCFFIMDHLNRKCIHFAFTTHPSPSWIWCEIKRAYTKYKRPNKIILDNDSTFSLWLETKVKVELGIDFHRTAVCSPWENAVAERFVRTCREELFNRLPPMLGCSHAERMMARFVDFYNQHRIHSTLDYSSPDGIPSTTRPSVDAKIETVPVCHGIWNYYRWKAA